jgi:hypothetical protein
MPSDPGRSRLDREGKFTFWNTGAEGITGYLKQEVLGRLCSEGFLQRSEGKNNALAGNAAPLLATLTKRRARSRHASVSERQVRPFHPGAAADHSTAQRRRQHSGAVEIFDPTASAARQNRRQSKLRAAGCLETLTGALNHAIFWGDKFHVT